MIQFRVYRGQLKQSHFWQKQELKYSIAAITPILPAYASMTNDIRIRGGGGGGGGGGEEGDTSCIIPGEIIRRKNDQVDLQQRE